LIPTVQRVKNGQVWNQEVAGERQILGFIAEKTL
jgi:hypothetical protein